LKLKDLPPAVPAAVPARGTPKRTPVAQPASHTPTSGIVRGLGALDEPQHLVPAACPACAGAGCEHCCQTGRAEYCRADVFELIREEAR